MPPSVYLPPSYRGGLVEIRRERIERSIVAQIGEQQFEGIKRGGRLSYRSGQLRGGTGRDDGTEHAGLEGRPARGDRRTAGRGEGQPIRDDRRRRQVHQHIVRPRRGTGSGRGHGQRSSLGRPRSGRAAAAGRRGGHGQRSSLGRPRSGRAAAAGRRGGGEAGRGRGSTGGGVTVGATHRGRVVRPAQNVLDGG